MKRCNEAYGGRRRGAVVPLVAICLVGLMSFVALAIDVGVLLVARTQCQAIADSAALAGTRELTGDPTTTYNSSSALPSARTAAKLNTVLGQAVTDPQVTVSLGKYYYNRTTARFVAFPSDTGSVNDATAPYSLVQSVITATPPTYFANVFGISQFNIGATATAIARPRDIALIVDFSGSMSLDSQLAVPLTNGAGTAIAARTTSMNPDPDFPKFGPYSNTAGFGLSSSATASYQAVSGEYIGTSNTSYDTVRGDPSIIGNDFFQDNAAFGAGVPAFSRAPTAYATTPAGDQYRLKAGYPVRNVNEVLGRKIWTMLDAQGNALNYDTATSNGGSNPKDGNNFYYVKTSTAADHTNTSIVPFGGTDGRVSRITRLPSPVADTNTGTTVPFGVAVNTTAPQTYIAGTSQSISTYNYATKTWVTSTHVARVVPRDATWESTGYGSSYAGYTTGPGFWGKTFFMWPPDPRGPTTAGDVSATNDAKDWRQRFFVMEFQPSGTPTTGTGVPGRPAPPPTTTGSGSTSGSTSSTSSSSSSSTTGSSPPPPPPPPSPLAYSVVGGVNNNAVLFQSSTGNSDYGNMLAPGTGVTWPATINSAGWEGTQYNSGSEYAITTNYDSRPFQQTASGTANYVSTAAGTNYNASGEAIRNAYGTYRYRFNYDAILYWLKNVGANPFPPRLRAGGILYYSSIPDTITSPSGNMPVATQAQRDMRFWKEYIDFALGWNQSSGGGWSRIGMFQGYGDLEIPDVTDPSGTNPFPLVTTGTSAFRASILPKPCTQTIVTRRYESAEFTANPSGVRNSVAMTIVDDRYMDYRDNPRRPITQMWFGPLTMLDFMSNFHRQQFWLPGTSHEAPMWQLKAGVQTAVDDIKNNHPNDFVSVIGFSKPKWTGGGTGVGSGYYNAVRAPLCQDYKRIKNSLFFPQYVIDNMREITPYDYDATTNAYISGAMDSVPRSVQGTCSPLALMLAYNQFSDNATCASFAGNSGSSGYGMGGGLGRLGASKLVIFETDGVASATATTPGSEAASAIFSQGATSANGSNSSYFKVRWTDTGVPELPDYVYGPSATAVTQSKKIADILTNRTDGTDPFTNATGQTPGFSTARKPVQIHCIGFGTLFNTANAGAAQTSALDLLQYMQYRGGTQTSASSPLPNYKLINQTIWDDGANNPATSRKAALQNAFLKSMQDTVSVVLIR